MSAGSVKSNSSSGWTGGRTPGPNANRERAPQVPLPASTLADIFAKLAHGNCRVILNSLTRSTCLSRTWICWALYAPVRAPCSHDSNHVGSFLQELTSDVRLVSKILLFTSQVRRITRHRYYFILRVLWLTYCWPHRSSGAPSGSSRFTAEACAWWIVFT